MTKAEVLTLLFFLYNLSAKEEEKNRLLKRSEELKVERIQLEAKAKQLSNAIMVSKEVLFILYLLMWNTLVAFLVPVTILLLLKIILL